jgi:hypothetical protein
VIKEAYGVRGWPANLQVGEPSELLANSSVAAD